MDTKRAESLAEFVRRVRREKRLSTPDVERNSGNQITDGYVSQIENGYIKNVSPEKLHALAKGLQVSDDEIFAVARGKSLEPSDIMEEVNVLFFGWEDASEEDKAATLDAIRMIASGFQQRRVKGSATFSGKTEMKVSGSVKKGKKK
jgi:transcriptional regulator with XRE-family HTH domain